MENTNEFQINNDQNEVQINIEDDEYIQPEGYESDPLVQNDESKQNKKNDNDDDFDNKSRPGYKIKRGELKKDGEVIGQMLFGNGETNNNPNNNEQENHRNERRRQRRRKPKKEYDVEEIKKQNHTSHIFINCVFVVAFVLFIPQCIELSYYAWWSVIAMLGTIVPLFIMADWSYNACIGVKEKLYVPKTYHINNAPICEICKTTKPERAHHCRKCGRCVLKMDHHCPFVGSCIGYANQKYFFLTLFYTHLLSLALIIETVICCVLLSKGIMKEKEQFRGEGIMYIIHLVQILICGYFLVVSFMMLTQQIYRLIMNESGIESKQNDYECLTFRQNRVMNKYNIGIVKNIQEVFGKNIVKGLFPIWTTKGDGYHYPSNLNTV